MTKPKGIELKNITSKITPESYFGNKKFIVGIHISADRASCSLAFENDPLKIFHIKTWDKADYSEQRYPSTIRYNPISNSITCGLETYHEYYSKDEEISVYDLLSEHFEGGSKSIRGFVNLTASKVITAFFLDLLDNADIIFARILKEEKDRYLAHHDLLINRAIDPEEIRQKIEKKFSYGREHCRYCISGPIDERYRKLMREVFVNSGIISKHDPQERLLFVSNAESLGHHLISRNEYHNEFVDGSRFIVCDISYDAVNFAIVNVDATESRSSVQAYNTTNAPDIQGRRPLETLYRHHLALNGFSGQKLEEQVEKCRNEMMKSTLDNPKDLMGIALESFLLTITSTLSFLYDSDERIMKIYCFGDLMAHPHIYDRIESFTIASEILELVNSDECFSKGAIIHGLLVEKLKLPAVVENITRNKDEQTKKEYDNPISNKDYDLIIGIDFGTTYSGVSFALPGADVIHSVRDWPSTELQKAPTLLLYNTEKKKLENEWGGTAKSMINKETEIIDSFKLSLSPKSIKNYYGPGNSDIDKIIKKNNLGSLDITQMIVHYLRRLIETARKSIESTILLPRRNPRIKYILTVPCMWTEAAKTTMLDAAVKAGLANNEDEITLITEPEAAALYFDQIIERLSPLHSYFIVCDAGGGTVDLVTYATDTDEETSYLNSIQQFGEGCGDTCGSNQINQAFERYLVGCFPNELRKKKEFFRYLMDKFEIMKYDFRGNESSFMFPLPKFMKRVTNYKQTPGTCVIKDGKLYIRGRIIKDMFDVMIQKTINLLEIEYKKTQHIQRVNLVIMVGGFSRSPYLRSEVEKWCKSRDIELSGNGGNLMIAVSHGAVSYGLNPRLITRRTASQSYALLVEKTQGIKSLDHFIWKNDIIDMDNHYTKKITLDKTYNMVIAIFSYDGARSDDYTTNSSYIDYKDTYLKVLEFRVDKCQYQEAVFVKLQFTPTDVECYVYYDAENFEYGAANILKTYSYKLRYPGLRGDVDAMQVLNELKYSPNSLKKKNM